MHVFFILILPFSSNMRNKNKCFDITNNKILAYTDVIKITQTCMQLGFKVHILEQHSILSSRGKPHVTNISCSVVSLAL